MSADSQGVVRVSHAYSWEQKRFCNSLELLCNREEWSISKRETIFKALLTPKIPSAQTNPRRCPAHYGEKATVHGPLPRMLHPPKARKLGAPPWPIDDDTGERVQFVTPSRGLIRSRNKHTETVRNCKIDSFFPSSHSLLAMISKNGYSVQNSAIFWVTFVITSKNKASSPCFCLFCAWIKQRWRPKVN